MHRETVIYHADGLHFRGQLLFETARHARPGVLVFPEAFGIGDHSIAWAERLAALGYVALACDLHGDARFVDDLQAAMDLLQPLLITPARTRARAAAALEALKARPEVDRDRIAAIGFCFPIPLELARAGADLRSVAGFHTGLATAAPATAGAIKARVLVCVGADDPFIPPEQRAAFAVEMREAAADWEMIVHGRTVHSFTNRRAAERNMPDAIRYSPEADARSWEALRQLLSATLG